MTDEEETGDNDADKRPRVYGSASGERGHVEVTVQGGEGETSDDVMDHLHKAVEEMTSAQATLNEDESREPGVE